MKKRNKLLMQREEGQGTITVLYRRADSPKVTVSNYDDLTETVNADGTMTAVYTLPLEGEVSFDGGYPGDTTSLGHESPHNEPDIKEVIFYKAKLNGIRFEYNRLVERIEFKRCKTEAVTTLYRAFVNCFELREIKGIENWNVSNVTSMYGTFTGCRKLTKVNISTWDAPNCTDMTYMFYRCDNLEEVDATNLKTPRVESTNQMFCYCGNLITFKASNWVTSSITNMAGMFRYCEKLSNLDVSNWDVSNAIYIQVMFDGCKSLSYLDVSKWDTSNATSIIMMFKDCTNLGNLDLSSWNTSKVDMLISMFEGCESMTVIDTSSFDTSNVRTMLYMFKNCKNAVSISASHFIMDNVTMTNSMFEGCTSLTNLNVENWNMNSLGSADSMFKGCSSLTSLNVGNWNMSKVSSAVSMFEGCTSLTRLTGIGNWNMSNCKDISRILYECTEIKPVENIGGWKISNKCTSMKEAFYQLHFNFLNITGWDTSNVTNMEGAFYNLVPVDANGNLAPNTGVLAISGFDFTKCTNFSNWITGSRYGNVSIRNIKLPNATSLESFIRCPGATKYNFSNWDWSNIPTGKMISFKGLFGQCLNATSFNFSNWNLREDFGFSWTTEDPALVTNCPWTSVITSGCSTVTINKIKTFDTDWRNA